MRRIGFRIVLAVVLVAAGWSIGKAQGTPPEFEFTVDAPVGETTVTCTRGCSLAWVARGFSPSTTPKTDFTFKCGGATVTRCSSGALGGWVSR